MLSKGSVRLLKWMNKNDELLYCHEIETRYPQFEDRDLKALKDGMYIDTREDLYDPVIDAASGEMVYPEQYQINSTGKACLESRVTDIIDKWVTRTISVAALVISLIALLSQLGILKLQAG